MTLSLCLISGASTRRHKSPPICVWSPPLPPCGPPTKPCEFRIVKRRAGSHFRYAGSVGLDSRFTSVRRLGFFRFSIRCTMQRLCSAVINSSVSSATSFIASMGFPSALPGALNSHQRYLAGEHTSASTSVITDYITSIIQARKCQAKNKKNLTRATSHATLNLHSLRGFPASMWTSCPIPVGPRHPASLPLRNGRYFFVRARKNYKNSLTSFAISTTL